MVGKHKHFSYLYAGRSLSREDHVCYIIAQKRLDSLIDIIGTLLIAMKRK